MTLAELNSVLHETMLMPENRDDQGCFYVKPARHPHVSLMIEDGHLVRVDIDKSGTSTEEGVQVGDSEKKVLGVYPNVKVENHKYNSAGNYLTVKSKDDRYGIRFETDKGKVEESMRERRRPSST